MQYYVKHGTTRIEFDTIAPAKDDDVIFHTHHTWYREPTGNGQWFGGAAEVSKTQAGRIYSSLLGFEVSKREYDEWLTYARRNTEVTPDIGFANLGAIRRLELYRDEDE